jgi:dipeptide/tripeptide permease
MDGERDTVTTAGETSSRARGATFLGHPKGLLYLAFTEAWERFSYYGMSALFVLFMVNQLLLPGHVEHIGGFSGFRATVESIVGPLSTQALASQIFGLYSGFVYFTPLLGGMIADRFIGQRNAVVIDTATCRRAWNGASSRVPKDSLASELVTIFSAMKHDARFGIDIHGPKL